MDFNVIVLGGGPGGYEAAIRCSQLGLKTALIEARDLGGTCLNRGCIPTKSLLHSAEVYETAKSAASYGVTVGDDVTFDYKVMAAHKDQTIVKLRKGIAALEKAHGVKVITGFGVLQDANTVEIGDQVVTAEKIILATGSAPVRPPIPGIDGENILTSDEVLSLTECPESMVIIGGGVIGMEFASLYSALGKKVTVLEMMPSILPGIDTEITQQLAGLLKKKGVDIITSAQVLSLNGGQRVEVKYQKDATEFSVSGECCLVCVGRKPMTSGIGLETLGMSLERGFIQIDDRMQTSVPDIYAIGDITGKIQLAHVASAQGLVAAANCNGQGDSLNYKIVPSCIYTNPEIATVGMTEEQALKEGKTVKVGRFNMPSNGKTMVMGVQTGVMKIVTESCTGEILGAQMFAPRATDMIGEIAAVMKCEGTIEELAATIHPHPTVCEAIMEAAHDVHGLCCHAMPSK